MGCCHLRFTGVADRCLLAQRRARSGLPGSGTSSAAVQGTSHEQRGACVTWPVRRLTPCYVLYVAQLRTQWHPQPPTLIAVLPKLLCKVKNRAHKKTTRSLAKSRKPKKNPQTEGDPHIHTHNVDLYYVPTLEPDFSFSQEITPNTRNPQKPMKPTRPMLPR